MLPPLITEPRSRVVPFMSSWMVYWLLSVLLGAAEILLEIPPSTRDWPLPVAMWLAFTSIGGPMTLVAALVLNALFLKGAWDIWNRDESAAEADAYLTERKFFKLSLAYLFLHFGALLVDATWRAFA